MKHLFPLAAVLTAVLLFALTAFAAADGDPVPYVNEDGEPQTPITDYTNITSETTDWQDGWYVASGTVEIEELIAVTGNVSLLLTDGCSLNAKKGIAVQSNSVFSIYAQSTGENMGALTAEAYGRGSAIGRTNMTGSITISGGKITANTSGEGAAIGGSFNAADDMAFIAIKGGLINANSSGCGAAIGGSRDGNLGTISISGGTVNAKTAGSGSAIGSGQGESWGRIVITGGSVNAISEDGDAPAIGGETEITILGGTVVASATGSGATIGGKNNTYAYRINISGGTVIASASGDGAAIGNVDDTIASRIDISGGSIAATASGRGAAIGNGYITHTYEYNESKIRITGGNTTAISTGTGAAIGGDENGISGTITILGGTVSARASKGGAAIGGGYRGGCGNIIISGGNVTADASGNGAAIGSGINGDGGGDIRITGGSVKATAPDHGVAIGADGCAISLAWKNESDFVYATNYLGSILLASRFAAADTGKKYGPSIADVGLISGKLLIPDTEKAAALYTWTSADFALPESIACVETDAFAGIASETVLVPASVSSIGAGAFRNSGLKQIRFLGTNAMIEDTAFEGCSRVIAFAPAESSMLKRLTLIPNVIALPLN